MIKKFILLSLLLNLSLQIYTLPKKSWTFFTYIAADNDLSPFVDGDLKEMIAGTNENVNTLVYLNTKESNTKKSKKLIITKNGITQRGTDLNLDSGAANTLINAIKWAVTESPSDYISINLWNHGSGPLNPRKSRGVCFDDSTGNYLNDKDLQLALRETVKLIGKKINILCFDSCLMASIEGDASWVDYVDYVVASEETIPGYGWGYDKVLPILEKSIVEPRNFAYEMVNAYKQTYLREKDYTMSAVSTNNIKDLANYVDQISKELIFLLKSQIGNTFRNILVKTRNYTTSFTEPSYIDLKHFYTNLLTNISKLNTNNPVIHQRLAHLKNLVNLAIESIKTNVINNVSGPDYPNASGISIYFPTSWIDTSYSALDWTAKYPNWLLFLRTFLKRKQSRAVDFYLKNSRTCK